MRRHRREKVQHKVDILCSELKRRVGRGEIGRNDGSRLDSIAWARDAEEAICLAVNPSDDGPGELLVIPELCDCGWKIGGLIAR